MLTTPSIKYVNQRRDIGESNLQQDAERSALTGVLRLMCHVLIIEDEPLIAMLVCEILQDEGATSFAFADTQDGAVASAVAHPPDVITSDVKLLQGTGPLAVDAIHQKLGVIPVIFITGTPADCEPCDPPGQVLGKPINVAELAAAFHDMAPSRRQCFAKPFRAASHSAVHFPLDEGLLSGGSSFTLND